MSRIVQDINVNEYVELNDVSAPANPANGKGRLYKKTGDDGIFWKPDSAGAEVDLTPATPDQTFSTMLFLPTDVLVNEIDTMGYIDELASGATGDASVTLSLRNSHLYLFVNTIAGTPPHTVRIAGTYLSESSGVPTTVTLGAGHEDVVIDNTTSQLYQTDRKWIKLTDIDIPASATSINYDYGALSFLDFGNISHRLEGYRCDVLATTGPGSEASDLAIVILSVKQPVPSSKKTTIAVLEDFGYDADGGGGDWIDDLRTAGDDRSYTLAGDRLLDSGEQMTFKMGDFTTFFSGDSRNVFESASLQEGVIVKIIGKPGSVGTFPFSSGTGISNVEHAIITLNWSRVFA